MMTTRMFRKSSIKDVALRAGVSTTTVSYFVNGREDVCAAETAKRIRAAIDELQYTPSSLTRGLRHTPTRTIGVCLYSPLDPDVEYGGVFFEHLWRGIVKAADDADYSLLHYPRSARSGPHSDSFLDGRVDGLLFHGLDHERARKVVRAGMPAVMLPRSKQLPDGCGAVSADEEQTMRLALDHLFALGHRRIAHLAGPARPNSNPYTGSQEPDDNAFRRLQAFTERMKIEGCFDSCLIGYADSWEDTEGKAGVVVEEWMTSPNPPTAILCANDVIARAAIAAATLLGVAVPTRLSVVGIDDSELARTSPVPITSVAVPVEEIGRESVHCLLRLMSGDPVEACRVCVPVTKIVVRGSSAPVGL